MRLVTTLLLTLVLASGIAFAQDTYGNKTLYSADINTASSGDTTLVAAHTGEKIAVRKLWLVSSDVVNVIFKSATSAFNASAIPLTAAGSSIFFPADGIPYWTTGTGEAFVINLSAAKQVTGRIYYTLE